MPDAIFDFILALGGLGAIGFAAVMIIIPRIEARERRQMSKTHPAR